MNDLEMAEIIRGWKVGRVEGGFYNMKAGKMGSGLADCKVNGCTADKRMGMGRPGFLIFQLQVEFAAYSFTYF
jgi:hypothetical protein